MAVSPDLTRPQAVGGVALLVVVVAISWAPSLLAPLGDNHEGRVDARFALQVKNLDESGLSGSDWVSSMEPYSGSYANHPPGPNAAQAVVASVAGHGDAQVRFFPYLAGLLALPAAASLLRAVGCSRAATVAAVALLAGTPLYWCFGRLLWDVPVLFAAPVAALVVHGSSRRVLVAAAVVILAAVTMSWIGGATAAAFVTVGWFTRRPDRDRKAMLVLAGAGLLAVALNLAWFFAATSTTTLAEQVEFRTTGGSFTVGQFISTQVDNLLTLVPVWNLLLAAAGGWAIRRAAGPARTTLAMSSALGLAFVVALPNGSYIHDYWIYPLLVPMAIGGALAADAAIGRWAGVLTPARIAIAGTTIGVVLVLSMALGGVGQSYFRDPEAAGTLAKRTRPATGQDVAWTANGVDTARWLSLYWDLPARPLDQTHLSRVDAGDLVFLTEPLPSPFRDLPTLDREGGYAVVRIGNLQARCRAEPGACEGDG